MKQTYLYKNLCLSFPGLVIVFLMFLSLNGYAQNLRRPISPDQPMWLVHIDTWNYADPQKIIDLIPEDIRPYVVMNISISISHDVATGRFQVAEYGYEVAKSWVRTCAQNKMWVMIQQSSGGYAQFSDSDLSVYEEFYQDYPNVIGFNYAEQFWGFNDANDPLSPDWMDRMEHFANLLELSNQYGGYLVVSWCGNQWSPSINPIAMMKRNANFAAACSQYTENYILCEKYTQQSYQSDMESICLGAYLSGYSGQYGIRYDDTGWTNVAGEHEDFTMATGLAPHLEHVMLTGETVIDGPELIWSQCFRETGTVQSSDGYTSRNWETFPQFDNVNVEIFRKILDGTVRIPSRQEVIDRSKYVVINDVSSGTDNEKYSTPETLFEGLYRVDGDGNYQNNKTFFKKTGRYPTIPTVYQLDDAVANSFENQINKSNYNTYWPAVADKVTALNNEFPEEYTGDLFAGRHENGWVVYNPYKTGQTATANIPFKYNTCNAMDLTFSQYSAGVVKETSGQLNFYLNNYDNELNTNLKTDVIKIYGSTDEPVYSYSERGNHQFSNLISTWQDGVFTLTVQHNGALDITINCEGTATDRLTEYTPSNLTQPVAPIVYTGPLQYEAEVFDRKNVAGVTTSGYSGNIRNYTGQGYLEFGTGATAGVRDVVTVPNYGNYQIDIRYALLNVSVTTIDMYVNGAFASTLTFAPTATLNDWGINTQYVDLNAGANTIEFKANAAASGSVYFDNIVVTSAGANQIWLEAECGNAGSLWDYVNEGTASNSQYLQIQEGNNSTANAPTAANAIIAYDFAVGDSDSYAIWARLLTPDGNSNSLWIRVDEGEWFHWDSITPSASWGWSQSQTYMLEAGVHTLQIAYSEDGVGLDKIYITSTTDLPSGGGSSAPTLCQNPADIGIVLTANPVNQEIVLNWSLENVSWSSQEIYRSTDADFADSTLLATVGSTQVAYTDATALLDVNYYYWIKGINSGVNALSNPANAKVSSDIWMEAECASVGDMWNTFADYRASNDYYVTVAAGTNSTEAVPEGAEAYVTFNFTVQEADTYAFWARLLCPGASDNSFWVKMDDGAWISWAEITTSDDWSWIQQGTYTLTQGEHTLTIGFQEDGAKLDKIYLSRLESIPATTGAATLGCEVTPDTALVLALDLVNNEIVLNWILENTQFINQEVYRSEDEDINNATLIATLDGVAQNYTDVTAAQGVTYYYWIIGFNGDSTEISSNMVSGMVEDTGSDIWLEMECAEVGSLWNIIADTTASNGNYVTIQAGNNSNSAAPIDTTGHIVFDIEVPTSGMYTLWARAQSPSASDDSIWLKMNNGNWDLWNGVTGSAAWSWGQFLTYNLTAGVNTLTVGYREDGLKLDKIYLTKTTIVPNGTGGAAETCSPPRITLIAQNISNNIVLNWTIENTTFASQEIYRSLDSNFNNATVIGTVGGTIVTYNDATATSQITYYYWIKGIYDDNTTLLSNVSSAMLQSTAADVWLEAECATVGSLWNVNEDTNASNSHYVTIQPGNNSNGGAPENSDGHIVFTIEIVQAGSYSLWARKQSPTPNDDSFYIKMDNASWGTWNGITPSTDWAWAQYQTYNLTVGSHVLKIAYREDGATLDKIYLTPTTIVPSGIGEEAGNCDIANTEFNNLDVSGALTIYPNPVEDEYINVTAFFINASKINARIVNTIGQVVYSEDIGVKGHGRQNFTLRVSQLASGMYILQLESEEGITSQKFIKK
jgi:Glycosyl hydrolase family 98/Secretion system C-terminal sorting domain/Glycosyl hydrolase family 98 C-terminal domain